MPLVKVLSEDLDALDVALDAVASSFAAKLAALDLPAGTLDALNEDVAALSALAAPAPVEPPAGSVVEEPPAV